MEMAGSAAALGQWPPSLRSPRAQRSGGTLPGSPARLPPARGRARGGCAGAAAATRAQPGRSPGALGARKPAGRMLTSWGEGEKKKKKDGEREKLKDFNTNNLQGVFCKQNGGQGARSTCLSALTLIVRGRRGKNPALAARVLVVCPCPSGWGGGGCCLAVVGATVKPNLTPKSTGYLPRICSASTASVLGDARGSECLLKLLVV